MTTNVLDQRSEVAVMDGFDPELSVLAVGRRCRVTAGAMKGLEGTISQTRREKILLEVHLLGQDTLMEINPDRVEPIE